MPSGTCPDEGRGTARRICERLKVPLNHYAGFAVSGYTKKPNQLGHRRRVSDEELRDRNASVPLRSSRQKAVIT